MTKLAANDIGTIKDLLILIDNSIDKLSFSLDNHPLRPFKINKYSVSKRDNFEYLINDFVESSNKIVDQLSELFNESNLNSTNIETLVSYKKIINMVEKYKGSMTLNKMIIEPKSISLKTVFEFASSVLTKYIELKDKINNKYSAETLDIKVSDLLTDYREIKDSKSLFKNKNKNLIDLLNNELREYRTFE